MSEFLSVTVPTLTCVRVVSELVRKRGNTSFIPLGHIGLRLQEPLPDVFLVDDIIPVKNRAGFVTANCHCNPFGHTSSNHIPHSGTSQIMEELAFDVCQTASFAPVKVELPTMSTRPSAFLEISGRKRIVPS